MLEQGPPIVYKGHTLDHKAYTDLARYPSDLEAFYRFSTYGQILTSKFVLCRARIRKPDSYRLWEVLYLGAIPIIERTQGGWDDLLVDLPVLLVDSYEEITPEFLRERYAFILGKCGTFDLRRLTKAYYLHLDKKAGDDEVGGGHDAAPLYKTGGQPLRAAAGLWVGAGASIFAGAAAASFKTAEDEAYGPFYSARAESRDEAYRPQQIDAAGGDRTRSSGPIHPPLRQSPKPSRVVTRARRAPYNTISCGGRTKSREDRPFPLRLDLQRTLTQPTILIILALQTQLLTRRKPLPHLLGDVQDVRRDVDRRRHWRRADRARYGLRQLRRADAPFSVFLFEMRVRKLNRDAFERRARVREVA